MGEAPQKEVWITAGLPGSGKSTVSKQITANRSYEAFSQDKEAEIARPEMLTWDMHRLGQSIVELNDAAVQAGRVDFRLEEQARVLIKQAAVHIPHIRQWISEQIQYLQDMAVFESPAQHKTTQGVLQFLHRLYHTDNPIQLIAVGLGEMDYLMLAVKTISERNAVNKTVASQRDVLFEYHRNNFRDDRAKFQRFFRFEGIKPCLLLVQNTKEHLQRVLKERTRATPAHAEIFEEDYVEQIILQTDPISPDEGFDKVVVVDNSQRLPIQEIIRRMQGSTTQQITEEIPFVISA
ncbi:AAA family ATPase [Candidatus Peregrinibacteria bacterium]|jgi:hypothetical protein|nr:AAA family ATPase [Candidatus Peregrinibacteria bacterium]MBT4055784.1 AAA family ATPase [Candidatus Peregrinibacteria bacterium]